MTQNKANRKMKLNVTKSENELISEFILDTIIFPKIMEMRKPKLVGKRPKVIKINTNISSKESPNDKKVSIIKDTKEGNKKNDKPQTAKSRPKKSVKKEPTHKEQSTNTDHMSQYLPPLKPEEKTVPKKKVTVKKPKPKTDIKKKEKEEKPNEPLQMDVSQQIEEIGDSALVKPCVLSETLNDLSISEITVKFSRKN